MFGVEKQQLGICLLKSNLDVIEKDLVVHRAALPELDAENEMKCRETIDAFNTLRSYSEEVDKLTEENAHLTAQRILLKGQVDAAAKNFQVACKHRVSLTKFIKKEQREIEQQVYSYEESLKDIANRFRTTTYYSKEEEINKELDEVNSIIDKLELELNKKETLVGEMKKQVDAMHPDMPEHFLDIMYDILFSFNRNDINGKQELEEKLKSITEEYQMIGEKLRAMSM